MQFNRCPLFVYETDNLILIEVKGGDGKFEYKKVQKQLSNHSLCLNQDLQTIHFIEKKDLLNFQTIHFIEKKDGSKTCVDCFSRGVFGISKISSK
jgi:hypothetical protein